MLLILCLVDNNKTYSQLKLNESFEGTKFPPEGWSVSDTSSTGAWSHSIRTPYTGYRCAVSNFTSGISSNFLITKRIVPTDEDSLTFCFKQTFWKTYKDTFSVFISTTDSLPSSMTTRIMKFYDSVSYPAPILYARKSYSLAAYAGQTIWIGFQHVNLDGDNIRLDNVTVGKEMLNEVGIVENTFPRGNFGMCMFNAMQPVARIRNFGSGNQMSPFTITYRITGPSTTYESIRSDTLSAGSDKLITFDSLFPTTPGTYNVKIYTGLAGDENPFNDTLTSDFIITNYNFGGGNPASGGYYFTNSLNCEVDAPSKPQYCWKDTTGSISLTAGGADVSGGILTGDLNDGYFKIGNFLPLGYKIKFFGVEHDSVFITTNGVIGFRRNNILLSNDPSHFVNLMSQPVPAFAPLWMDLDFSGSAADAQRLSYKIAGNQLIITFDRAKLNNGNSDEYVSFQVCLETGISMTGNSRINVQFNESSTGEGFLERYHSNTLPPHLTGMKNLFGTKYIMYRLVDSLTTMTGGPLFNSSMAVEFGSDQNMLNSGPTQLDLTFFMEALMPGMDTVLVSLRDSRNGFKKVESRKIITNDSGSASCNLTIPDGSYPYYISISHKNSIETWSKPYGESFTGHYLNYDFSNGIEMAFGGNLLERDGLTYIYTGDLNQDKVVNAADITIMHNALTTFTPGTNTDINGDGALSLHDFIYCCNNSAKFVTAITP